MEKRQDRNNNYLIIVLTILGIFITAVFSHDYVLSRTEIHGIHTRYSDSMLESDINIVFYKNDNPYCESGLSKFKDAAKESDIPTLFIDVESQDGQKLLVRFDVVKVPTIVMVRNGAISLDYYAYNRENEIFINTGYI